jgi:hypothetical protein
VFSRHGRTTWPVTVSPAFAVRMALSTSGGLSEILTVQASVMADHPFGPWLPADCDCGTMARRDLEVSGKPSH